MNFRVWNADEEINIDEEFKRILKSIYAGEKIITDAEMINIVANKLTDAVFKGFGNNFIQLDFGSPDTDMLMHLHNNVYQFSSAKNYQQLKEINASLFDDKGKIVSFNDFKKKAEKINKVYNTNYLKTEYNLAINSSYTAARWVDFEANAKEMPYLQYQTAGDGRVREAHANLDNVIRKIDDDFWNIYYPPNGFGCRCGAIQLSGEADETDLSSKSLPDVPEIFKTNLAKKGLVFPADSNYFIDTPTELIANAAKLAQKESILKWSRQHLMSKSVSQFIKIGSKQLPIDIIFNKKGLHEYLYYSYRSNILNSAYYLSDIVKKSSYVGSFPNTETVKKPTITNYHYYKTKILGKDYFIAIEENTNKKFYLYAITNKLHKIKK